MPPAPIPWTTLALINHVAFFAVAQRILAKVKIEIAIRIGHLRPNTSLIVPYTGIMTVCARRKEVPIQKDSMLELLRSAAIPARQDPIITASIAPTVEMVQRKKTVSLNLSDFGAGVFSSGEANSLSMPRSLLLCVRKDISGSEVEAIM